MPDNEENSISSPKIPEQIRSFLTSDAIIAKRLSIFEGADLSPIDSIKIARALNGLYGRKISVLQWYEDIKKIFANDAEKAKKIALDLAGNEFLAVSDYLGGVDEFIRSLGGNPSGYKVEKIIVRAVTPTSLVTEFLHEHPVSIPAFLEHRLREILESRVREVRKDAETVTRLTRAEKIGGVEMKHDDAEALVAALVAKISGVQIAPDAVPPPPAPKEENADERQPEDGEEPAADSQQPTSIPVVAAAPSLSPPPKPSEAVSRSGHGMTADDEREADAIRERVLPKVMTSELFDLEREIREGAAEICASTVPPVPASMYERYRNIVASRLKGIRDLAETEDLLMREPSKGGMGFGKDLSEKVIREIEKHTAAINGKREMAMKNEKDDFIRKSVDYNYNKDESRKRGEQEDLDRLYGSLTGRVSKTVIPATPPPQPRPAAVPSGLQSVSQTVPQPPAVNAQPAKTTPAPLPPPPPARPLSVAPLAGDGLKAPVAGSQQPVSGNPLPIPPPPRPAVVVNEQSPNSKITQPAPPTIGNPLPIPPPPRPADAPGTQQPKTVVPPPPSPRPAPAVQQPAPVSQAPHVAYKPQAAPLSYQQVAPAVSQQPMARMQDVRPAAAAVRLTGLAEELKNMTLADFRRLSSDPAEACRKINDKLDLLEEQAYARRIEGIQAWQSSEVNRLYLQTISAAFSTGKPIADVIAETQAANRPTPTEREVHAIMDLNRSLKA